MTENESDASSESEGEGDTVGSDSERSTDDEHYESDFVVSDTNTELSGTERVVSVSCKRKRRTGGKRTHSTTPKQRRVVMSDDSESEE